MLAFSPVAEATDGGLKCFAGVNVNVSGLEGPACGLSMTMKEVSVLWIAAAVLWLPPGSAERVG